ncbi:DUF4865 family protein [Pantoea sp. GD03673]|uniref:DUF4865 family protein n=1 Tax=Pantoea sp. GD03673 TaxID=2975364 RepID=UPI00244D7982|nr:DUF4865 family protein [Pantoea sp. GD03673]MDH2067156.1 DUF4865 family protein [Pantoea sp. GD03673]
MIIMHYRFTLPADYDMGIIAQRISLNGARLDGFPGLVAKAYLYACREEGGLNENRYAPLYFWREASGMQRFLQSPGFMKLVRDFGWPIIESWLAFDEQTHITDLAEARFMALHRWTISPHTHLATLPMTTGFSAWDVTRWQGLTVSASRQPSASGPEVYRIGYLARGAAASDLQL